MEARKSREWEKDKMNREEKTDEERRMLMGGCEVKESRGCEQRIKGKGMRRKKSIGAREIAIQENEDRKRD